MPVLPGEELGEIRRYVCIALSRARRTNEPALRRLRSGLASGLLRGPRNTDGGASPASFARFDDESAAVAIQGLQPFGDVRQSQSSRFVGGTSSTRS